MSTLELETYIRMRELAQENPLIELEEPELEAPPNEKDDLLDRLRWLDDNDQQNRFYQRVSDEDLDPLSRIATGGGLEETLISFLSRQLDRSKLGETSYGLVVYLIHCLGEDGYLRIPLEELSQQGAIPLPHLEQALSVLKTLEPTGVGASSLSQCLALQLERINETGPVLAIVKDYLPQLAQHHDRIIANRLGITTEQVEQARQIIQELEPRPGAVFQYLEHTPYSRPDLLVEEQDGRLIVIPLRVERPPFMISPYYQRLLKESADREVKQYLFEKLKQAESVLWAAEQRKSTLMQCAQTIIDRKAAFFQKGQEFLAPLRMAEIAADLNLHESTVSRTVRENISKAPGEFIRSAFSSPERPAQRKRTVSAVRRPGNCFCA